MTTPETERLMPCPFCGEPAELSIAYPEFPKISQYTYGCASCDVWIGEGRDEGWPTKAEAITAWNTRTDPTTICNRLSDMEMVEAAAKVISEVANLSGQHMTEILARRYAQTAITVLAPLLRAQRDREIIAWLRDKAVHRGDFLYEASDELESGQVPLNKGREIDG